MADRWLVIFQRHGVLSPSIYLDYLPSTLTGKRAKQEGVFHIERLDPGDTRTLDECWVEYRRDLAYREANAAHPLPLSGTKEESS